ncbi:growth factor receptor-bound protein 14-like [Clavelina lepadiformis]|uniref:growth factor receptor-bound protein 14-like n=1 Tax=Clavelina lepadiformis TaxID=159417 RepID=UPI0040437A0A
MSTCVQSQKLLENKEDDVDLESLIQQIDIGNDDTSQTDVTDLSSSSGDGDALHESNESITSEEGSHTTNKTSFFDKHFLKSLPVAILAKRKLFGSHSDLACSSHSSAHAHSMPSTPSSSQSSSLLHQKMERMNSCKIQRNGSKQINWNIWVTDLARWKEIELPHSSTCALLLHKLLTKLQRNPDLTQWSIIEQNSETMIERYVEDCEIMDDLISSSETENIVRFCLNKTSAKYTILQNPELCLPPDMLTYPGNSSSAIAGVDSVRRMQMQHILTKTAPEMCGWLHVREVGRRSWKKLYCILRNSGLYFSNKNTSKEPMNLVCIAEVHSARVWFPVNNKKVANNSPTAFSFCLKPRSFRTGSIIRWFCAENNHVRSAWISALRLTMNGSRFHESYLSARRYGPTNLIRSSSDRAINKYDSNFVAMDFSGATGRIIQDPMEATMVELEQQSSWRRRLMNRTINNSAAMERGLVGNSAPTRDIAWFTRAIHQTQPWFYGKISREAATDEIQRHGSLDGTFLVRDSHTIPGGIVITICHNQKSRHIPVTQLEKDGKCFYTSDNGETRFLDLIQFIDFHRLNKGSLPCVLVHECHRSYH